MIGKSKHCYYRTVFIQIILEATSLFFA